MCYRMLQDGHTDTNMYVQISGVVNTFLCMLYILLLWTTSPQQAEDNKPEWKGEQEYCLYLRLPAQAEVEQLLHDNGKKRSSF